MQYMVCFLCNGIIASITVKGLEEKNVKKYCMLNFVIAMNIVKHIFSSYVIQPLY